MRLRISLLTTILLLLSQTISAFELPVRVKLNNDYLQTTSEPESIDGTIYVPIEPFARAFGASVEWDSINQKAQITTAEKQIIISPEGSQAITADSSEELSIKTIYSDSVLKVGLTSFVELFGATVVWDQSQRTAQVIDSTATFDSSSIAVLNYSEEELMTLARLITVESSGCSLEHNLAVANVILNRVKSDKFANTIIDVIYQPGQFPSARRASFKKIKPLPLCLYAARLSLEGLNNIGNSLYFNNYPFKWKPRSHLYKVIQGQYFYL